MWMEWTVIILENTSYIFMSVTLQFEQNLSFAVKSHKDNNVVDGCVFASATTWILRHGRWFHPPPTAMWVQLRFLFRVRSLKLLELVVVVSRLELLVVII